MQVPIAPYVYRPAGQETSLIQLLNVLYPLECVDVPVAQYEQVPAYEPVESNLEYRPRGQSHIPLVPQVESDLALSLCLRLSL